MENKQLLDIYKKSIEAISLKLIITLYVKTIPNDQELGAKIRELLDKKL